jgi:5,5'-dehydrodivanillate O-demethylase oxygenase subunit
MTERDSVEHDASAAYRQVWQTGPDTLSGRYLRRFWHPVFRSEDLQPGYSVPIKILSERFTLYRGESGVAHIVGFRCAHRGTQLSTGRVEDDCLRCMYHGWKYDGAGRCVEQPREDPGFAARITIPAYPTREYIGLIWGYFGEGEPPRLERHPDFEGPGILDLEDPEYWPCNFFNRIDNACDIGHVAYTHYEALIRANDTPTRSTYHASQREWTCEEAEYGIKTTITFPGRAPEYFHYHVPLANQNSEAASLHRGGVDTAGQRNRRISWRVPIDDENTVSFSVNLLQVTPEEYEAFRERRAKATTSDPPAMAEAILAGKLRERDLDKSVPRPALFSVEDYLTQVGQGPVAPREDDHLGKIDHGVILLRKIWERELRAVAEGKPTKDWTPKPEGSE